MRMWKYLWNWLMGRGWKNVGEQTRLCPESCEQEATGAAEGGSHGPGADRSKEREGHTDEGHTDEVSNGNEGPIGKWNKGHPCYVVANNLATLCPCPKTLWEAQVQPDGLVLLAEEIAKQQSISAAAWMLLAAVSQLCEENQEQKGAEEKDLEGSQPGQRQKGDKAVCLGQEKRLARGISSSRGQLCASRKALEASRSSRPTSPVQSHQRPRGGPVLQKPFPAQSCQEGAPGCSVHSRSLGRETTPAGGQPGRCPDGAGFTGQQDARVMGSRQLPSRFASKAQEHKPSRGARSEPLRAAISREGLKVELQRRPTRSRSTSSMPGKPRRTAGTSMQPQGAAARAKNSRAVEAQGPPSTIQGLLQRNLEPSQIPTAGAQSVPTASTHARPSGNAPSRIPQKVTTRAP